MRFTPQLGRKSVAADTKSFPYFFSNVSRSLNSSGISEHLGAANIKLDIPSFRSAGHSLEKYGDSISVTNGYEFINRNSIFTSTFALK